MRKHGIPGKINVGCLIITFILAAAGYVGFKFGMVYMTRYLLYRKIFTIAGDVAADPNFKLFPSDRAIAEAIIEEAKKLSADIPLDNIDISRNGQSVTLQVLWEGDIILPGYTHHFAFTMEAHRQVSY